MNIDEQEPKPAKLNFLDWSKELWLALLFVCIGWTVWPLMVYFLGRSIGFEYFQNLTLRVWAEEIVYGALPKLNFRSLISFLFLFLPWITSLFIRITLFNSRRKLEKSS